MKKQSSIKNNKKEDIEFWKNVDKHIPHGGSPGRWNDNKPGWDRDILGKDKKWKAMRNELQN
jgi:hypothetical protein